MPEAVPLTAADLTDEFVLARCDYFTTVQMWPLWKELNPRLWLANFLESEQRHARYLLNSFLYFSVPVIEQVVVDCIERISCDIVLPCDSLSEARSRWQGFADDLRIVLVRGESVHPTDSGYIFTRIARDRLDLPEARILEPEQAVGELIAGIQAPFVFVDDFVGSGNQFVETWHHEWTAHGQSRSFADLSDGTSTFYYCPVLATSKGLEFIEHDCPDVVLVPGHELPPRYSAFDADSVFWPADLRGSAEAVIKEASARAGIPDLNGDVGDWRGYDELGLSVAFAHGVPDATLPLYWWESDTWNPLKKRHHEAEA